MQNEAEVVIEVTKKDIWKRENAQTLAGMRRCRVNGYWLKPCVAPVSGAFPEQSRRVVKIFSPPEKITNSLLHHRSADLGNGLGKRNILGADFHAVLRIATFLDAAIAHQRR